MTTAGVTSGGVSVPFQIGSGIITVEITVNETGPYSVGLDTGGILCMSPGLAHQLNLQNEGTEEIVGSGAGTSLGWWTTVDSVGISEAHLERQKALVFGTSQDHVGVYGIGQEIFRNFVVRIDYQTQDLTLIPPSQFQYQGKGIVLPLEFAGDAPIVSGEVDGVEGKFLIDTGSTRSLMLATPFCERHKLYDRYPQTVQGVVAQGLGGPIQGQVARANMLKLGGMTVQGPVTILTRMQAGVFADSQLAGNIGQGVLRRFITTLDYSRQRLFLEPSADYDKLDVYDRAGIHLDDENGMVMVQDVIEGGPADTAGVCIGDVVLQIDGQEAGYVEDLKAPFLQSEGTDILLLLRTEEKERQVSIALREMI